eukprot:6195677-Pleurochrysis_carterae.AAC.5
MWPALSATVVLRQGHPHEQSSLARYHSPNCISYMEKTKSNSETSKNTIALACEKARPQMQRDAATLPNLPAKVASPRLQLTHFKKMVD